MNWVTAPVFFPIGRLTEHFIQIYIARYSYPVAGDQYLDGVLVAQSPVESDAHLSMLRQDDNPLTRFGKASYYDGTVAPCPVYAPSLELGESPGEGHVLTGHIILAGWPETFLSDIANPPEEIAELFIGVKIYTES